MFVYPFPLWLHNHSTIPPSFRPGTPPSNPTKPSGIAFFGGNYLRSDGNGQQRGTHDTTHNHLQRLAVGPKKDGKVHSKNAKSKKQISSQLHTISSSKETTKIKGGNFSWHFHLDIYKLPTASCLLYQPTSTNPTTPKLISNTPSPSNHSNLSSHSIGSRFGLACSIRLWKPWSTANATVGAILALAFIPDFNAWSSHKVIICVLSWSEGMKPWYRSLSSMNHIYILIYKYYHIIYINIQVGPMWKLYMIVWIYVWTLFIYVLDIVVCSDML